MRLRHDRGFYIPNGATCIQDDQSTAVAHLGAVTTHATRNPFWLVAFRGRAQKPAMNYIYPTEERRAKAMEGFFADVRAAEAFKARQAAERKAAERGLEVGDVLRCSWGWEQTNVDFYQVNSLVGKKSVELRAIAQQSEETGFMQGKCVPIPNAFKGAPFRRQARNGGVRINSYSHAFRMEPIAEVAGVKMYAASHWTAYA